MSSEDSATYSDAQSGYNISDDTSPILSNNSTDAPDAQLKQSFSSDASLFLRSESLFLVLLFAAIALLLPAFFFYVSNTSPKAAPDDTSETRESPLTDLLAYAIPVLSTLFHLAFSVSYTLSRPFITLSSLFLSLLAPVFIAVDIMSKVLVIVPARIVMWLVQLFYPLYLFCGAACVLGGVVGLGGVLLVEGSKLMLLPTPDKTKVQRGIRRQK